MKLYGIDEAPKYLTTNPYIKHGFRQCKSLSDSISSIMYTFTKTRLIHTQAFYPFAQE